MRGVEGSNAKGGAKENLCRPAVGGKEDEKKRNRFQLQKKVGNGGGQKLLENKRGGFEARGKLQEIAFIDEWGSIK